MVKGSKATKETREKLRLSHLGQKSWNKGKKMSDEQKKKLSLALKGRTGNSGSFKKGQISPRKGARLTEQQKKQISENNKGRIPWNKGKKGIYSEETLKKMGLWQKGKPMDEELKKKISRALLAKKMVRSIETRRKISEAQKGQNGHNWKGGVTDAYSQIRKSFEYKLWRESVLKRDKWTCIWCLKNQGWDKTLKTHIKLHADHIKPFAYYPELRFAIDNGRTLCEACHRTTDTWGRSNKPRHSS